MLTASLLQHTFFLQSDIVGRMRRSSEPTGVEQDRVSTASDVGPSPLARDFRDSRDDIISRASNSSPPPPPPDRATSGWTEITLKSCSAVHRSHVKFRQEQEINWVPLKLVFLVSTVILNEILKVNMGNLSVHAIKAYNSFVRGRSSRTST